MTIPPRQTRVPGVPAPTVTTEVLGPTGATLATSVDNAAAGLSLSAAQAANPLKSTAPLKGSQEEQIASLMAQNAEMAKHVQELTTVAAGLIRQAQTNAVPVPAVAAVKLPTMAEAMADVKARLERGEPVHSVLTTEGHYVHPLAGYQAPPGVAMDPKSLAAMATAIVAAQASAAASSAAKPKKAEAIMEPGKGPKDED